MKVIRTIESTIDALTTPFSLHLASFAYLAVALLVYHLGAVEDATYIAINGILFVQFAIMAKIDNKEHQRMKEADARLQATMNELRIAATALTTHNPPDWS